ncbi:glutamate-5-semialdehyde dehydrogenase [Helicobacter sp. T3_23-1056]
MQKTSQSKLTQSQKNAILAKLKCLKNASHSLALASADTRNTALLHIASLLKSNKESIKKANAIDIQNARKNGLSPAMIQRLILDDKQIDSMCQSVLEIRSQNEVLGEVLGGGVRPSGIHICQIAVPLGVVAIIYESRPNVTIDAAALCLKSGNAALLKGGKEAQHSNEILGQIVQEALILAGLSKDCALVLTPNLLQDIFQEKNTQNLTQTAIQNTIQEVIIEIMQARDFIDLLIPRGGKGLIDFVIKHSKIPIICHEAGICHAYIDKDLDNKGEQYALDICQNAKISRPSACNAIECVLIHADIAGKILPKLVQNLAQKGVECRICEAGIKILESLQNDINAQDLQALSSKIKPASNADFGKEFGGLIIAIKVVKSIDEALSHIAKYGSKHSEIIITQNLESSRYFCDNVESSAVFVNASSRFNDGGEFGLGAEIGISTQKLHARGPMGARHLTTTKYIVQGNGNIRE